MPRQPLGFASVVVAGDDGPYASVERGWRFAEAWGSRHVMPGWRGHISSADKLGLWAEGHAFLEELVQTFAPVALDRRHPF